MIYFTSHHHHQAIEFLEENIIINFSWTASSAATSLLLSTLLAKIN